MSTRWFAASDVMAFTARDAHAYNLSNKSRRVAAPIGGSPNRTCGWIETDCASCQVDLAEPRHGFSSDLTKVPATMSEMEYTWGKAQKAATTIESLRAQLDELELA
jgi:hypothetical protein